MKNGNLFVSKIYEIFKLFFNFVMSFFEKYWLNKNDRDSNINLVNKI